MIQVKDLTKVYRSGEIETKALDQVTLTIEEGEFVAIMGRSGCGKSTLLNLLGGMDTPTSGSYFLDQIEVSQLKGKELSDFRNKKLGFVYQSFYLANEMNAIHNVSLPLGYAGVGKKARQDRAKELLMKLNLGHRLYYKPFQLSGGEQQRVAIARALANSPSLLLADEPTGNLDLENSDVVIDIFRQLRKENMTIVMVTHDENVAKHADRIIRMSEGKIET